MPRTPQKSVGAVVNGVNGSRASSSTPPSPHITTRPLGPLSVLVDKEKTRDRELEPAKVNNSSAADLKNACDDALKHVRIHFPFSPPAPCSNSTLPVPFTSRPVSPESRTYRCATGAGLVVRARGIWHGLIWLENRVRRSETRGVDWCDSVRPCHLFHLRRRSLLCRYVVLSLVQTLYAYFVEGDTVFVGKRKTFDKRVSLFSLLRPPYLIFPWLDCH